MFPASPARLAVLDKLTMLLPPMQCRRLCQNACTSPIDTTPTEVAVLGDTGLLIASATAARDGGPRQGMCPALDRQGNCAVYARRPFICRFWGVVSWMSCPHGCVPEGGFLDDTTALNAMIDWSVIDETDAEQLGFARELRARVAVQAHLRKALIWRIFVYANASIYGPHDRMQASARLAQAMRQGGTRRTGRHNRRNRSRGAR